MNFFYGFHLSGWYNLASLRNVVSTSLTVEVNKEHGERGEGGEGGEGEGEEVIGGEEII